MMLEKKTTKEICEKNIALFDGQSYLYKNNCNTNKVWVSQESEIEFFYNLINLIEPALKDSDFSKENEDFLTIYECCLELIRKKIKNRIKELKGEKE